MSSGLTSSGSTGMDCSRVVVGSGEILGPTEACFGAESDSESEVSSDDDDDSVFEENCNLFIHLVCTS